MANNDVTWVIILKDTLVFNVANPTIVVSISGVPGPTPLVFNAVGNSANFLNRITPFISSAVHDFVVDINPTNISGTLVSGSIGTLTVTVNNSTPPSSGSGNIIFSAESGTVTGLAEFFVNCLHGSSMIETRNGSKRLDQIQSGDEVLSGNNLDEYAQVKSIAHCWLSFMGVDHDAIIFEADSLGENEPSQRLIIDPGHPMCSKEEYLEKGYEALRPAGSYWEELKGDKVYTKKWTDTYVQDEPSRRYDLILEEPYNTYVANGMVVRAKGYKDHRYKRFV